VQILVQKLLQLVLGEDLGRLLVGNRRERQYKSTYNRCASRTVTTAPDSSLANTVQDDHGSLAILFTDLNSRQPFNEGFQL
jgi:hypothetical protein